MAVVHLKRWNFSLGTGQPLVVIAGLNVLENLELALNVGRRLQAITADLGLPFVFKASFDKANRSSIKSYRGPGLKDGLAMLAEVKRSLNLPLPPTSTRSTKPSPWLQSRTWCRSQPSSAARPIWLLPRATNSER
jgi:3-deoxy-D-manno-octulosonic acid (KDO) 8-phosphate synthase